MDSMVKEFRINRDKNSDTLTITWLLANKQQVESILKRDFSFWGAADKSSIRLQGRAVLKHLLYLPTATFQRENRS